MTLSTLEMPVDATEVLEARAVIEKWAGRSQHLPTALRTEVERIVCENAPEGIASVEVVGGELVVSLSPEVRAMVANLRARETV